MPKSGKVHKEAEKLAHASKPAKPYSLQRILERARDLGVPDLAEQHDHYLYGTQKR